MKLTQIGVLALQGGFALHLEMLKRMNAEARPVRHQEELEAVDALIIPGGESTTIGMLLARRGLDASIASRIREGMPVFGTCAGLILLAEEVEGRRDSSLSALKVRVTRNAYGSQTESFEASLELKDGSWEVSDFPGVFIRAPRIDDMGPGVSVLSEFNEHPVLVRQGNILAASFHPELSSSPEVHRYFLEMAR